MENTLEGIKNRLGNTEERISDLKDRITEITQNSKRKTNYKIKEGQVKGL